MIDALIIEFDSALRTVFASATSSRPMPGEEMSEVQLDEAEWRHAVALMRVNHCGEICAQALYQGQSLTCRSQDVRQALVYAAREETEHLNWTERRIASLGGRKSLLNPVWYCGALAIGLAVGKMGDGWSLGFLAETERQVELHLGRHLAVLPAGDPKSRAVLEQMRADEAKHARTAIGLGARELPAIVKSAMAVASAVMVATAYRI